MGQRHVGVYLEHMMNECNRPGRVGTARSQGIMNVKLGVNGMVFHGAIGRQHDVFPRQTSAWPLSSVIFTTLQSFHPFDKHLRISLK